MTPIQVAEAYFACMRARDVGGLKGLYAKDAVFVLPTGQEFAGRDAIVGMHEGVFGAGAPVPSAQAMIVGHDAIAVEIEARLPDGSVRFTTNHFHLDGEGQIRRLNVYWRG